VLFSLLDKDIATADDEIGKGQVDNILQYLNNKQAVSLPLVDSKNIEEGQIEFEIEVKAADEEQKPAAEETTEAKEEVANRGLENIPGFVFLTLVFALCYVFSSLFFLCF
jgi:hypothetical protein